MDKTPKTWPTTTYSAAQILEAIRRDLGAYGEGLGDASLQNWKPRGFWPIEEHGKGWTKYGVTDAARLLAQADLNRRVGLTLEMASYIARANGAEWPSPGDDRRYLVFAHPEPPSFEDRAGIAACFGMKHVNTGAPLGGVSAVVIDAVDAAERIAARLAEVEAEAHIKSTEAALTEAEAEVEHAEADLAKAKGQTEVERATKRLEDAKAEAKLGRQLLADLKAALAAGKSYAEFKQGR